MATKKKTKKAGIRNLFTKSKSLVSSAPARRMAWGGVMPQVGSSEKNTVALQKFCNTVAKVYGIPSLGVNAQGGNPYINKDGRLYLLNELRKGKSAIKNIKTDFIQLSTALNVPAIVKKTLIFRDGTEVEAIGEASADNVKLDAVKKTLNMMAETRAMNRAIWQAIAGDVWNRVAENIAALTLTPLEKSRVMKAGQTSAEEMDQPERDDTFVPQNDNDMIAYLKRKVDDDNDTGSLIQKSIQLMKGAASAKVKREVNGYINAKVDVLNNPK